MPLAETGKTSQMVSLIVPADGTASARATGRYLYVISAPQGIQVRLDQESLVDAQTGTSLETTGDAFFDGFEIRNLNSVPVTVKVFVGFARYNEAARTIIEGPTDTDGWNGTQINAGASQDFAGAPAGLQIRRRSIQVFNLDANNILEIHDSAGDRIGIVFPQTGITLNHSGWVRVHNPGASAIQCAISETWYVRAS